MTGEAVTERTITKSAVTSAGFVVLLTVTAPDCFAAPRVERAVVESSTFFMSVVKSMDTGGEPSSRVGSPGWSHGLQLAVLNIDSGKLGDDAHRAVSRWPAAQKAEPAWEWARVLVFLVQTALIVQGHDPGKLDGLMGPKTMLALLEWSAASGPSWDGNNERSYRWGLDGNVAHLLHGTLEAQGLSPGPKDQFLGRESVTALDRWDGTFRRAGMFMRFSEDTGRDIVMDELGATGPSDSREAAGRSTARESTDRSRGSGYTKYQCLNIYWGTSWMGYQPTCYDDPGTAVEEGMCAWWLAVRTTCPYRLTVYLLVDLKDGRGPRWARHPSGGMEFYVYPDEDRTASNHALGHRPWEVPKGVTPDVRYCAHRIDDYEDLVTRFTDKGAKSSHNRWYRNDYRDGRLDGDMRADVSRANHLGDYAPNTTCLDTH